MTDVRTQVTASMIIIIVVSNCILHNGNDDATSSLLAPLLSPVDTRYIYHIICIN